VSPRRANRQRTPDEQEWIEAFHDALLLVQDEILPLTDEEYRASRVHQAAASDALSRIRTAAQHLTGETLRRMPEVNAQDIAAIRNLAVYEYPTRREMLVLRTLRNHAPSWRSGIDRVRGTTRDGEAPAARPTRSTGSRSARREPRLCGRPVASAGDAPCILRSGHGGHCRSR
jgi:uncharacterized protein with HEPN domain